MDVCFGCSMDGNSLFVKKAPIIFYVFVQKERVIKKRVTPNFQVTLPLREKSRAQIEIRIEVYQVEVRTDRGRGVKSVRP